MSKLKDRIFSINDTSVDQKQIRLLGLKIKIHKKIKPVYYYEEFPIENDKIVFRTFNGSYNCNPKYIAEEILKQKLPYKLFWIVNKNILKFIDDFDRDNIKLIMDGTAEDTFHSSTAKIIIDNERRTNYIKRKIFKRPGQIYIQTFHGSLGIKKTGVDRNDGNKNALLIARADSEQIDYLISNSKYETDFLKRMFWGYGQILKYGHPRNDVFFKNGDEIKNKIYKYFNISKDKKIVMYAPTLREDKNFDNYNLDFKKTVEALNKRFNENFVALIRFHPLLIQNKNKLFMTKNTDIIDATDYSDMQELLVATDVLITDYSSSIYDFVLSRKPGFIFATDAEKYDNKRGFYYPLSSTPFLVANNNDEMVKNIENFDENKYKNKVEYFLKEKGCIEDGKASKRVVDLIKDIMKKENL